MSFAQQHHKYDYIFILSSEQLSFTFGTFSGHCHAIRNRRRCSACTVELRFVGHYSKEGLLLLFVCNVRLTLRSTRHIEQTIALALPFASAPVIVEEAARSINLYDAFLFNLSPLSTYRCGYGPSTLSIEMTRTAAAMRINTSSRSRPLRSFPVSAYSCDTYSVAVPGRQSCIHLYKLSSPSTVL